MFKKMVLVVLIGVSFTSHAEKVKANNQVLGVNDFAHGERVNLLGGIEGGDEEVPGVCFGNVHYENSNDILGLTGEVLSLSYDVRKAGSYSFYWMKLGRPLPEETFSNLDLSSYHYLGFWVRGKEGRERFKIEVHEDSDGDGHYVVDKDQSSFVYVDQYIRKGITKDWSKVSIPLADFKKIKDWSKIAEIVFTFENFATLQKRGIIYIDDIIFGTYPLTFQEILDSNPNMELPFHLTKDSVKVNGRLLKEGMTFDSLKDFSVSLEGDLSSLESVWLVFSQDGVKWKTSGKFFLEGKTPTFSGKATDLGFDPSKPATFDIWAFDVLGRKVTLEVPLKNVNLKALSDDEFLEELEKRSFKYFWDEWNSGSGLFLDSTITHYSSIAATGFGLSAYCIGVKRGWVSADEVKKRVSKTIDTFLSKAANRSGFFYHFLDMNSGSRFGGCEVSVVDTSILLFGLLSVGEYFGGDIQKRVEEIYSKIVWSDFLIQDKENLHFNQFYMGWRPEGSPDGKFLDAYWDYYTDELILINFLAISSRTHPVTPEIFYAWKREKGNYDDRPEFIQSWTGGLFAYQYAHAWIDFRQMKDREGINWWQNSLEATWANRQYCIDQMSRFKTYGPLSWGISSMAYPNTTEINGVIQMREDYTMNYGAMPCGTGFPLHDGTIAPSGPEASVSFFPKAVISTLKSMIVEHPEIWGEYGFRSSYNTDLNWFSTSYYGIDLGVSLLSIENERSGFIWSLMMKNSHIKEALKKTGFKKDRTVYKEAKLQDTPILEKK